MSCGLYCAVANELLCGKPSVWDGIKAARAFYQTQPELAPYLDTFGRIEPDILPALPKSEISSSGYVLHTLEATLWCLERHDSFRACLLEAVNLGRGHRHRRRCGRRAGRAEIWRYPGGLVLCHCPPGRD